MTRCRAVFLDRDGVLNPAVVVDGKSYPPADADTLEPLPGVVEAVGRLQAAGYVCICVTNQPDVARGTRTRENVEAMNEKVRCLLGLDDLYACLHDTPDNCQCRKPKPGMLLAAAEKWDIDLAASWMIGDRSTDAAAGKAAGCRTILVGGGHTPDAAEYRCPDMVAAAEIIVGAGA